MNERVSEGSQIETITNFLEMEDEIALKEEIILKGSEIEEEGEEEEALGSEPLEEEKARDRQSSLRCEEPEEEKSVSTQQWLTKRGSSRVDQYELLQHAEKEHAEEEFYKRRMEDLKEAKVGDNMKEETESYGEDDFESETVYDEEEE